MFINSLIIALHLTLIFSDNPAKDCNYYDYPLNGCRINNKIVIALQPIDETVDHIFKEELCHAIINRNPTLLNEAYNLPDIRPYSGYTEQEIAGEKAADYCIKYLNHDTNRYAQQFNILIDKRVAEILNNK